MAFTFLLKKNNSKSTLNGSITNVATSIVVASGAAFPATGNFICTIWDKTTYPDPSDDPNMEIVKVTARSTNTLTVVRAQESTSGVAHASGVNIELLFTIGQIQELETRINAGPVIGSPVSGATINEILSVDASGNLTQSANLYYNGSLGLGMNTPYADLHIRELTGIGLVIERSAATPANTYGFYNTGNSRFVMNCDSYAGNPSMEFHRGAAPYAQGSVAGYIDFAYTDGIDFDARIIMYDQQALLIQGSANFCVYAQNMGLGSPAYPNPSSHIPNVGVQKIFQMADDGDQNQPSCVVLNLTSSSGGTEAKQDIEFSNGYWAADMAVIEVITDDAASSPASSINFYTNNGGGLVKGMIIDSAQNVMCPNLPTADPGDGLNKLWYDAGTRQVFMGT